MIYSYEWVNYSTFGSRDMRNKEDKLTHFDTSGKAVMVDVSSKSDTLRIAVAKGLIRMKPATLAIIQAGEIGKGDVLGVARLAGIMAAKRTWELIPLCHNIPLGSVEIQFEIDSKGISIEIQATVRTTGKTGAEMEALTAVSVAALTIYDMVKAVDKGMEIGGICLVEKSGGKSGHYRR